MLKIFNILLLLIPLPAGNLGRNLEAATSDLRVNAGKQLGREASRLARKIIQRLLRSWNLSNTRRKTEPWKKGTKRTTLPRKSITRSRTSISHPMLILVPLLHKTKHQKEHISLHLGFSHKPGKLFKDSSPFFPTQPHKGEYLTSRTTKTRN